MNQSSAPAAPASSAPASSTGLTFDDMKAAHAAHNAAHSATSLSTCPADRFTPCSWFAEHGF